MKLFTRTAVAVLAVAATASAAWADAREVRIASHVSEFSPLHAQSKLFAEEIENRLPGQFVFKVTPVLLLYGNSGTEVVCEVIEQAGAEDIRLVGIDGIDQHGNTRIDHGTGNGQF